MNLIIKEMEENLRQPKMLDGATLKSGEPARQSMTSTANVTVTQGPLSSERQGSNKRIVFQTQTDDSRKQINFQDGTAKPIIVGSV